MLYMGNTTENYFCSKGGVFLSIELSSNARTVLGSVI